MHGKYDPGVADAGAQRGSQPVSADLVPCIRRGAQAEYDQACTTMYRSRDGADEAQIRAWQDAEERAERHEALLNRLGPEDVDISPGLDLADEYAEAVSEALARYARDFPGDPLRQQVKALRRDTKKRQRTKLRKAS